MDPIDFIVSHGSMDSNLKVEYFAFSVKVAIFSSISDRSAFKVWVRRNACLSDPCFSTNSNLSFSLVMCSSICFVSNISFCAFDANLSFCPYTFSNKFFSSDSK
jgi:hypothetical protein